MGFLHHDFSQLLCCNLALVSMTIGAVH